MPLDEEIRRRIPLVAEFTAADIAAQPPLLVARAQEFARPVGRYRPPEVETEDLEVAGPHGPIPVRVYRPAATPPGTAGLVWLHGGGFRAGDLDMAEADAVSRELCVRASACVVSVDYRLATDGVHFPVPHDDVVAAWTWVVTAAGRLGIAPERLALGGASAGAGLAAGAALALRDDGAPLPSLLVLVYPTLHRELPAPSVPPPDDIDILPAVLRFPPEVMSTMNDNYLGEGAPSPYAFPGAGDLAGLPPTLLVTAGYDDLRASADAFARSLRAAGVQTAERCEPDAPHGYLNVPGLAAYDHTLRGIARALRGDAPG